MKNNLKKNGFSQKNSKMKFPDQKKFKNTQSHKNYPYYNEINSKIITTTCDGDSSCSINQKNASSSNTSSKTRSKLKKKSLSNSSKKREDEEDDYNKTIYNINISLYGFTSFLNKKIYSKNNILDINKYKNHQINFSFDQRYKQIKKYGFCTKIFIKPNNNSKFNEKNKKYIHSKFSRKKNIKSNLANKKNNEKEVKKRVIDYSGNIKGENTITESSVANTRNIILEEKFTLDNSGKKKILYKRQLNNNESNNVSNNSKINTLPDLKGKFIKRKSPTKLVKKTKNRIFSLDLSNNGIINNYYIKNNNRPTIKYDDSLNSLFNTMNNTKKNLDAKCKNLNQSNTKSYYNLFSSPSKTSEKNIDLYSYKYINNLNSSKSKITDNKFSPYKSYNYIQKPLFIEKSNKQSNSNKNNISKNFAIDIPQRKYHLSNIKNVFPDRITIYFENDNKIKSNIFYLKNKFSKRARSPNSILLNNRFNNRKNITSYHIREPKKNSPESKNVSKNYNYYIIQTKFNNNISK